MLPPVPVEAHAEAKRIRQARAKDPTTNALSEMVRKREFMGVTLPRSLFARHPGWEESCSASSVPFAPRWPRRHRLPDGRRPHEPGNQLFGSPQTIHWMMVFSCSALSPGTVPGGML